MSNEFCIILCTVNTSVLNCWVLVLLISWTPNKSHLKFTQLSCCDQLFVMSFPTKHATTLNEKPIALVGRQFHWWFPTKLHTNCLMHWNHRLQFMIIWHTLSLTLFATTAVSLLWAARLTVLSSMISVHGHVTYMHTVVTPMCNVALQVTTLHVFSLYMDKQQSILVPADKNLH